MLMVPPYGSAGRAEPTAGQPSSTGTASTAGVEPGAGDSSDSVSVPGPGLTTVNWAAVRKEWRRPESLFAAATALEDDVPGGVGELDAHLGPGVLGRAADVPPGLEDLPRSDGLEQDRWRPAGEVVTAQRVVREDVAADRLRGLAVDVEAHGHGEGGDRVDDLGQAQRRAVRGAEGGEGTGEVDRHDVARAERHRPQSAERGDGARQAGGGLHVARAGEEGGDGVGHDVDVRREGPDGDTELAVADEEDRYLGAARRGELLGGAWVLRAQRRSWRTSSPARSR